MSINLDTLPIIPLQKILEKCDFLDILCLRKTCKSLRASIAQIKPDFQIRELKIHQVSSEFIKLTIENLQIDYKKHENGCQINGKLLKNQDFLQIFLQDLMIIFEFQNSILSYFNIKFHGEDVRFYENLQKNLKSSGIPLKIENLNLEVSDQYQILSVLPYASEDFIGKLSISDPEQRDFPLNLEEVVKLNQWKKAKEIEILWVTVVQGVKDFVHFERCNVTNFGNLRAEDLVLVKETFFASSTPKFFHLGYANFIETEGFLEAEFGKQDVYPNDTDFEQRGWWLKIPDLEQVLHIEISDVYVEFTRMKMEEVPEHIRENL
ncbi:unnamed protein product [Caenorhabditis brenneri]